ncbi:hypothetical protein QBC35DRAFT_457463 [Podospora australis]|uniref:Uncharacterized protein n=1 Tax=Podospora australis TaxID=1536484 RepID=A0AAN7AD88_9PEZI|nr:hypothetical protein QBC35DRAFT_457463 [Podospora australis]
MGKPGLKNKRRGASTSTKRTTQTAAPTKATVAAPASTESISISKSTILPALDDITTITTPSGAPSLGVAAFRPSANAPEFIPGKETTLTVNSMATSKHAIKTPVRSAVETPSLVPAPVSVTSESISTNLMASASNVMAQTRINQTLHHPEVPFPPVISEPPSVPAVPQTPTMAPLPHSIPLDPRQRAELMLRLWMELGVRSRHRDHWEIPVSPADIELATHTTDVLPYFLELEPVIIQETNDDAIETRYAIRLAITDPSALNFVNKHVLVNVWYLLLFWDYEISARKRRVDLRTYLALAAGQAARKVQSRPFPDIYQVVDGIRTIHSDMASRYRELSRWAQDTGINFEPAERGATLSLAVRYWVASESYEVAKRVCRLAGKDLQE